MDSGRSEYVGRLMAGGRERMALGGRLTGRSGRIQALEPPRHAERGRQVTV
ncbi:hypothetical protein E2C01_087661 [Portunus trituberculatus]|uniref:Uncharacterized protein n=1 Tax=Portunus trituberculatus TaxID=210409 RepID=A0A5B7JEN6_PORTR|nr:hypothetical protein [Portunus trituberculatus]